ncbi:trimeric intracellular cation channel family protein [Pirellulaceae bacterium SH467]
METLNLILDFAGTFVFALSGAMMGVRYKLDIFGVLVLSFAAANSGGILRDVLIGSTPPRAIQDWRYLAVSLLAGLVTFFRYSKIDRLKSKLLLCDAVGLSLFAVAGANKALAFHLDPIPAIMLGMLTGIGGGMVRDLLVAEIPAVLRADFYALAALCGAAVVVAGNAWKLPSLPVSIAGGCLCFGLRYMAIRRNWRLPVAHGDEESPHGNLDPNHDKESG